MLNKINNFNYGNSFMNFKAFHVSQPSLNSDTITSPTPITPPETTKYQLPSFSCADILSNYNMAFINFRGESAGSIGYLAESGSESTGSMAKKNSKFL